MIIEITNKVIIKTPSYVDMQHYIMCERGSLE